jgi:hypothetical protein
MHAADVLEPLVERCRPRRTGSSHESIATARTSRADAGAGNEQFRNRRHNRVSAALTESFIAAASAVFRVRR